MKVAIIGYGKMGHQIENILKDRGHDVCLIIDEDNRQDLNAAELKRRGVDVAIEFTTPQTAFDNIRTCLTSSVPVVCGTTGWLDKLTEAEQLCKDHGTAFFYASNYSVGVNVFFKLSEYLAGMMSALDDYDVTLEETHHTQKKDAPSGTAITLAQGILAAVDRKKEWVCGLPTSPTDLQVSAVRRSIVPGTHVVTYESDEDSIEIRHTAVSRKGFATGAVRAAEFIAGRRGVFSMDDMLGFK